MPPPPTEPNDIGEVIRLLRQAETRAVTHGDLTKLSNSLMEGIKGVRDDVSALAARMTTNELAVDQLRQNVELIRVPTVPRKPSPLPQRYNPEETSPGGGLRVSKGEWDNIRALIDEHQEKLEAAEKAKREADLRREATEELLRAQEKIVIARRKRFIALSGILVPILIALGSAFEHYVLRGIEQPEQTQPARHP